MKHLKKFASLLLAVVMVLSMTVTTFGAVDLTKHTFDAYKIFDGELSDGKLVEITWGDGINAANFTDALIAAGYTDYTDAAGDAHTIEAGASAEEVASVIGMYSTDSEDAKAIARLAYANVVEGKGKSTAGNTFDAGYYVVVDTTDVQAGDAKNLALLKLLADDATITPALKTDAPSVDKQIKNEGEADSEYRDTNNVAIGDKVNYRITSTVPDMDAYTQYYFIMNDQMSEGLDFVEGSIVVTLGDKELKAGDDYVATVSGKTHIEIVFKDFIQYKDQKGAAIVVRYDAILNENCEIHEDGNPNWVDLTYSNNPNEKGEGKDKPTDSEKDKVTGTTPKDWTITYTTNVAIKKLSDDGQELAGAQFKVVGTKTNSTFKTKEVFEVDEDGEYYKLTDGTYTTTVPSDLTADQYDSIETKYKKSTVLDVENVTVDVEITGTTGEGGLLNLGSLAEGTYVITELVAPEGYNLLKEPVTIVVTCDSAETVVTGEEKAKWTVTQDGTEISRGDAELMGFDAYIVEIINYAGTVLPETGGAGTTMFYVIGAVLAVFAGVALISRRRMAR